MPSPSDAAWVCCSKASDVHEPATRPATIQAPEPSKLDLVETTISPSFTAMILVPLGKLAPSKGIPGMSVVWALTSVMTGLPILAIPVRVVFST
ncbi:hypothetical protein D3C81_1523960 [compost metagenome]